MSNNKTIPSVTQISEAVNKAVYVHGPGNERTMDVLLEIQKELKYVPSEAIQELCMTSDVTPGQVTELSTFYSQIRHNPTGKHIIQVCSGICCHLKSSKDVEKALKEYLKLDDNNCSPDNNFYLEEVDCLGACAVSPAIRIDDKMYGHVDPEQVESIITNFLETQDHQQTTIKKAVSQEVEAEIRVGIGTCCVAAGSKDVLTEVATIKENNNLNIRIKPVGCTGACSFTPILEIAKKNGEVKRYTNVQVVNVLSIMHENFGDIQASEKPANDEEYINKELELNTYLSTQKHLSTQYGGTLSPVSLIEYNKYGGMKNLQKCLDKYQPSNIISLVKKSGFKERSSQNLLGDIWATIEGDDSMGKCIVCNSEESDTGALKDRLLLESFPFKIIEGMIITGYASGITKGMFHISDLYPLAARRIKNAISQCRKSGYLGVNIANSTFSFDISVVEVPGDFVCGDGDEEFEGMPIIVNRPETLCTIPALINHCLTEELNRESEQFEPLAIISLTGSILTPGVIEIPSTNTLNEVINNYGGGVANGNVIKAAHVGGLAGSFVSPELFDLPLKHEIFRSEGINLGSSNILILNEHDSIVDLTEHFVDFACHQSCGKCTVCRVGTTLMHEILIKMVAKQAKQKDLTELEQLCSLVKKGSLCGLGQNAPNAVLSGLKYFRQEFENSLINE